MFVLHIALQGCLRAQDVEYGLTADTGGHIRYLLDLVTASRRNAAIDRIEIGDYVMLANGCFVGDAAHRHDDPDEPITRQGFEPGRPVRIGSNVWFGVHCVVTPGVEIGDRGRGFAAGPIEMPGAEGESGRGLAFLDALATRWGVVGNGESCVWFELEL